MEYMPVHTPVLGSRIRQQQLKVSFVLQIHVTSIDATSLHCDDLFLRIIFSYYILRAFTTLMVYCKDMKRFRMIQLCKLNTSRYGANTRFIYLFLHRNSDRAPD